jgi:hypothetical protein
MNELTPLYESHKDHAYREFFHAEAQARHLGAPGQWQGGSARKFQLQSPVQQPACVQLLRGRTPDGRESLLPRTFSREERVQGWRFSLVREGQLSVLWALSPEQARGWIQLAHRKAVQAAVAEFERQLNGRPLFDNPHAPQRKTALFAKFHRAATSDQAPRLETTLFLFNFVLQPGQPATSYTPGQVKQYVARMQSAYHRVLQREMLWAMGHPVRLPNEMVARFQQEVATGLKQARQIASVSLLSRPQLVAVWQEQARKIGWPPQQTAKLLREALSQPTWRNRIVNLQRFVQATSLRLRQSEHSPLHIALAQQGRHEPSQSASSRTRPQQQDFGHSH